MTRERLLVTNIIDSIFIIFLGGLVLIVIHLIFYKCNRNKIEIKIKNSKNK